MKKLTKFIVLGATLVSTAVSTAALAQQNGTREDNTGNYGTGGSGNQNQGRQDRDHGGGG